MSMINRTADDYKPLRLVEKSRPAKVVRPRLPRPITRPKPKPNPRASWPAWTDQAWTIASPVEPLDTRDHETPYVPSAESEAWWAGFCLGLDGEPAAPPAHYQGRVKVAFVAGRQSAWLMSDEALDWFAEMNAVRARTSPITDADVYRPGATS